MKNQAYNTVAVDILNAGIYTEEASFISSMLYEVDMARTKFPSSNLSTLALMEEVGELAQAVLKHAAAVTSGQHETRIDARKGELRREAVQVAVMAMRIALEGDPSVAAAKYVETGSE